MVKKYTIAFREVRAPIVAPVTKFGGQPCWLGEPQWPLSRANGMQMRFICQITLPLGAFGSAPVRMAYLFMTDPDSDSDWVDGAHEPDGGENALIFQPGGPTVPVVAQATGPTLYRMAAVPARTGWLRSPASSPSNSSRGRIRSSFRARNAGSGTRSAKNPTTHKYRMKRTRSAESRLPSGRRNPGWRTVALATAAGLLLRPVLHQFRRRWGRLCVPRPDRRRREVPLAMRVNHAVRGKSMNPMMSIDRRRSSGNPAAASAESRWPPARDARASSPPTPRRTSARPARPQRRPASPGQGQARRAALHVRRRQPVRHVRLQAGVDPAPRPDRSTRAARWSCSRAVPGA